MINKIKERKIILSCLIYQQSQVQEENHSSMQAISQGNPAIEIVHFERMGLDGLSSNSLILTRKLSIRGREGNNLLVYAHHHTFAHSLFFLSDSFFFSKFLIFPLIFHSFSYFFFPCFISPVLYFIPFHLLCTAKALFILLAVMGFLLFYPLTIFVLV